jgi:hypothetical protein
MPVKQNDDDFSKYRINNFMKQYDSRIRYSEKQPSFTTFPLVGTNG